MRGKRGQITVAAGVNGAGKSTILGRYIERSGGAYYNPDERTRALVASGMDAASANARSWQEGFDALRAAVDAGAHFSFETTLGGHSIIGELFRALALDRPVAVHYVGLSDVELHIRRVAARVARGGHDIPEARIRERFVASRENLLRLIGTKAAIRVWDNSEEDADGLPRPVEVLRIGDNQLLYPVTPTQLAATPGWAKAFVLRSIDVCALPAGLKKAVRAGRRSRQR